ncbi:MAG: hypothetical protein HUU22_00405 [Phycisphaerae bacterium]|nr:hypothetical protein [Phycisphaerae bacterium]NUQ44474.1 hypothetical protein [Phycisphaerae bacterium]
MQRFVTMLVLTIWPAAGILGPRPLRFTSESRQNATSCCCCGSGPCECGCEQPGLPVSQVPDEQPRWCSCDESPVPWNPPIRVSVERPERVWVLLPLSDHLVFAGLNSAVFSLHGPSPPEVTDVLETTVLLI